MAQVVTFETNARVNETIDELLRLCGIEHVSHYIPRNQPPPVGHFIGILRQHQPKVVLTSWRSIGPLVVAAVRNTRPKPGLWILSGYDETVFRAEEAFPWADRIFEKPFHIRRIIEELQHILGIPQERSA